MKQYIKPTAEQISLDIEHSLLLTSVEQGSGTTGKQFTEQEERPGSGLWDSMKEE